MKYNSNAKSFNVRSSAGDEIGLLVNLVRSEQIGMKMLLQNVTEILADDETLLVDVVLLMTDQNRIKSSEIAAEDYASAIIAVERSGELVGKSVLLSALQHAASKAGFLALPS